MLPQWPALSRVSQVSGVSNPISKSGRYCFHNLRGNRLSMPTPTAHPPGRWSAKASSQPPASILPSSRPHAGCQAGSSLPVSRDHLLDSVHPWGGMSQALRPAVSHLACPIATSLLSPPASQLVAPSLRARPPQPSGVTFPSCWLVPPGGRLLNSFQTGGKSTCLVAACLQLPGSNWQTTDWGPACAIYVHHLLRSRNGRISAVGPPGRGRPRLSSTALPVICCSCCNGVRDGPMAS